MVKSRKKKKTAKRDSFPCLQILEKSSYFASCLLVNAMWINNLNMRAHVYLKTGRLQLRESSCAKYVSQGSNTANGLS